MSSAYSYLLNHFPHLNSIISREILIYSQATRFIPVVIIISIPRSICKGIHMVIEWFVSGRGSVLLIAINRSMLTVSNRTVLIYPTIPFSCCISTYFHVDILKLNINIFIFII